MFDVHSIEAQNRVFECNYQKKDMFESVRCTKNDVQVDIMSNITIL